MTETLVAGFTYTAEIVDRNGIVVDSETVGNLMPDEGIAYVMDVALKGGTPSSAWYVGLFEGDYTPTVDDVMSTFPDLATESTDYESATRMAVTLGAIVGGVVTNLASRAEFVPTEQIDFRGAFISSASAKGATSGPLLSVARFSNVKAPNPDDDETLLVTVAFAMVSA